VVVGGVQGLQQCCNCTNSSMQPTLCSPNPSTLPPSLPLPSTPLNQQAKGKRKALAGPKLNVDCAKLAQLEQEKKELAAKKVATAAAKRAEAAASKRAVAAALFAPMVVPTKLCHTSSGELCFVVVGSGWEHCCSIIARWLVVSIHGNH